MPPGEISFHVHAFPKPSALKQPFSESSSGPIEHLGMADSTNKGPSSQQGEGFIIFRHGAIDDLQWERFMAFFKYQVRHSLHSEGESWFYDRIDWKTIVRSPLHT